ncbi:MAG: DUF1190 domain-containing protein [Magnetovibrio sp.]|nr:DUF1190 domain-containing protein [Magnetovibrio sp.]
MKRSKTLTLALMGVSVLALSACERAEEVGVFESAEQCSQLDGFGLADCENNFEVAQAEHIRVAPKYTSVEDCEADFGAAQCETSTQQTQSGGSVFMPMMMGFKMGNMLSGSSRTATQPLYRSKDDPKNFRTGDNQKVAGKTGLSKVSSRVASAPSTKTQTVRRGGFGASASSSARSSAGKFRSFGG